jgi:hypothetical protein
MAGLYPDEIAENYLALHRQHPSTWTQELDLRPWLESSEAPEFSPALRPSAGWPARRTSGR